MLDGSPPVPAGRTGKERWTGTVFAFLSTFFYAVSNVVVRYLTDYNVDHDWILFYKETIGFTILVPWLLLRLGQGRFRYTSKRLILIVIVAAVLCQLIGARLHVLGFAVIGLIIAVPLIQSSTLLGVALIGRYLLGDSLSRRRKMAITILIVAITILSVGKGLSGEHQPGGGASAWYFMLVAAGTVVTGIIYAVYITMIRYVIRQHWHDENSTRLSFRFRRWVGHDHERRPGERFYAPFPVTLTINLVLGTGMVIFGAFLYGKHGIAGFYSVPNLDGIPVHTAWLCMLISGISNATGFFFQIQGLRMTTAVQATLIAVSQMVLLSLIGYLYFGEAINIAVMLGLGLTIYGVFMSAKPEKG